MPHCMVLSLISKMNAHASGLPANSLLHHSIPHSSPDSIPVITDTQQQSACKQTPYIQIRLCSLALFLHM